MRTLSRARRMTKTDKRAAASSLDRDMQSVALWRRVREITSSIAVDPRLGTRLGRMFLISDPEPIDELLFEAGMRYSQLLFTYDRLVLGKIPQAQAQNLARQRGLSLSEPSTELVHLAGYKMLGCLLALGGRIIAGDDERSLTNGIPRIARSSLGPAALSVEAVCRDDGFGHGSSYVVEGLRLLAAHFGLYDNQAQRIRRWSESGNNASCSEVSHSELTELTEAAEALE
jgi:hypothetical protein